MTDDCPACGTIPDEDDRETTENSGTVYRCPECGHQWANETADGWGASIARAYIGHEVALVRSRGDGVDSEPDVPGYERVTLKNNLNPTFDVTHFSGRVDSLAFFNDDGELVNVLSLEGPVDIPSNATELTPQIWN